MPLVLAIKILMGGGLLESQWGLLGPQEADPEVEICVQEVYSQVLLH